MFNYTPKNYQFAQQYSKKVNFIPVFVTFE